MLPLFRRIARPVVRISGCFAGCQILRDPLESAERHGVGNQRVAKPLPPTPVVLHIVSMRNAHNENNSEPCTDFCDACSCSMPCPCHGGVCLAGEPSEQV